MNKTWQIGELLRPGISTAEITLQHDNNDEGSFFKTYKQNAYVSRFTGVVWDTAYPQSFPGAGYITSGNVLSNSGTNSRIFNSTISSASYFTKLTDTSLKKTNFWFNAYRLDSANVYTYWYTNPEINIKLFVVQRMLSNETSFKDVATVYSKASSGYNFTRLDYSATDPNDYRGISFYRLLMLSYTNDSTYSDTVAKSYKPGQYSIMIGLIQRPGTFSSSVYIKHFL